MNFLKKIFKNPQHSNAYDYSFKTLNKNTPLPLSLYRGKVILVVNTASKCGFTAQYKELEQLYQQYKDRGLVILGVPSNNFGKQEPGTAEEIAQFCEINFGVTFPLTEKEEVIGKNAHPFYRWAHKTLGLGSAPKWNFHKILIDKEGNLCDYFYSFTKPEGKGFKEEIESLLPH